MKLNAAILNVEAGGTNRNHCFRRLEQHKYQTMTRQGYESMVSSYFLNRVAFETVSATVRMCISLSAERERERDRWGLQLTVHTFLVQYLRIVEPYLIPKCSFILWRLIN